MYQVELKQQGSVKYNIYVDAPSALSAIRLALQKVNARPVNVRLSDGKWYTYYHYSAIAREQS